MATDPDGKPFDPEHDSPLEALARAVVPNWCGCGGDVHLGAEIGWYLFAIRGTKEDPFVPLSEARYITGRDARFAELIAHLADAAYLTEHGSSVGGAWLTPGGEQWLDFVWEELSTEWTLETYPD